MPRQAAAVGRDGAGIGLRSIHVDELVAGLGAPAFVEVHAENYMADAPGAAKLERIRRDRPLSLHGVGLSLGGADRPCRGHLARLRALIERFDPFLVSEHLSWSGGGGGFLNDLLPLPYDEESLAVVARNVDAAQAELGRRILIENPSRYLAFREATIPEPEFLAALVRRTGCGLLCDVNNIHVSACNLGFDAADYLARLPAAAIGEIHLAGHAVERLAGRPFLVDTHGAAVAEPVWSLYAAAVRRFGARPTLIEWDNDVPPLAVLLAEAARADAVVARIAAAPTADHALAS